MITLDQLKNAAKLLLEAADMKSRMYSRPDMVVVDQEAEAHAVLAEALVQLVLGQMRWDELGR